MKELIERIKDHVLTLKSLYIPQPVRETIAEQISLDLDELQKIVDKKGNNNLLDKILDGNRVAIPYEPLGPKDFSAFPQEELKPYVIRTGDNMWPNIRYTNSANIVSGCSGNIIGNITTSTIGTPITFTSSGMIKPIKLNATPHQKLYVTNTSNGYRLDSNGSKNGYNYDKLLEEIHQAMKEDKHKSFCRGGSV